MKMREAVKIAGKAAELEASGGVTLKSVRAIAETGRAADFRRRAHQGCRSPRSFGCVSPTN